ncbi:hypothetical protein OAP78_06835 [Candidatus Pelagibacter sp.]|nr:hypothetical protein [Candidatus Pelagibacter sp.]
MLIYKSHDDFPYYHFQYTYYLTQMTSVIGIGNFNLGFRTPSSIFYLNSLFYLPIVKFFMFQMGAFLIFLYSNIILISKLIHDKIKKKYNFLTFYYLLSFIFINIFFYRLSEHGTDRSAQILILILIGEILSFINFKVKIEKHLSKLFLLIALIISLKAFYVLYTIFSSIILYKLAKTYKIKAIVNYILSNFYLYLFLVLFSLIIIVNFLNTGCLIYPVSMTCFESNIWAISKSEVLDLNNWYEQWSKAGANPNFRIDNAEIYIQKFNWVNNWINEYFFTKVSDFLLGLIFLVVVVFFTFFPYQKSSKNNFTERKIAFTVVIIFILFMEWFYNHPSLRYGGFCLIASFLFIIFSIKIEKSKQKFFNIEKNISYLIIFTLIVFIGRNISRISKEYNQYGYNPIKSAFYRLEDANFDIDRKMKNIIKDNINCIKQEKNCNNNENIGVKKISNMFVFFIK